VDCAFREEQGNWILADMRNSYGRDSAGERHSTTLQTTKRLVIRMLH
jgi:hypothetical protein